METQTVLEARNIIKNLGGNTVLRGVSIALNKGDIKVLIGPSGSGKSTLLQCLNLLHIPEGGSLLLDNKPVNFKNKSELYQLRQKVGMIFQEFNLFDHLSAKENVSISLRKVKKQGRKEAAKRAEIELQRVGLDDKMNLYPAQLSGGQKQRVSIARALAMDPEVLLLDEPTSALDPELISEVLVVIRDLAKNGMTMLMATHQISFSAALAHEFVFMEDGIITEHGSPKELLAENATSRTKDFCAKIAELTGEQA
ncbi:amino acid ABC transporter ATP-binding protein [Desulfobacula sp.]|uniref:amino acid ABC transporter ATP-binding protein n=1 Tax=Desulfobacula sp. TaxID=2593537 RepID=UPI00261318B8|nr:amino acid ABC transporter ATP-binding protein [Desulfobacula sp.]